MVGFSMQLNDDLHGKLKITAIEQKKTMANVVAEALEKLFDEKNTQKTARKRRKTT